MSHGSMRRSHAAAVVLAVVVLPVVASCDGGGAPPTASRMPESAPPSTQSPADAPASDLPDFAITGYVRDPAEGQVVAPGTTVYFHVEVTNVGSGSYGQFVVVQGPGNYSGGFSGLMPGETKEATVELGVSMPGGGRVSDIYFAVDPDNITTESDEANNTLGPLVVEFGGG